MVKWPLRKRFPVLGLIEDLGIFGILWGEFLFHFLCRLSQGCRERELSDMGMVLPKYSLKSGHISLLGIDLSSILQFISFNSPKIS